MTTSAFRQGVLFATVLTALFLSDFIFHIGSPLGPGHNDVYLISFILKHYVSVFLQGNLKDILTLPMFYGIQDSLLLSEHYFLIGVAAVPLYLLKPDYIFTFNFLAVIAVWGNFVAMYVYVQYLTGKVWPSILAAVIFAYNPFVMSHFPDIIIYYTLGWIPLILLYIERALKEPTITYTFMIFVLLLLQLATTLTYLVYLAVILPVYVVVRMRQLKVPVRPLVNRGTVMGFILLAVVSLSVGRLYGQHYAKEPTGRTADETAFFSAWPTDYLFSPVTSLVYGGGRALVASVVPSYIFTRGETAEHNLFWGIVPTLLFIGGFVLLKRSKYRGLWLLSLGLLILSVLLSYGPKIQVSYTFSLPGPYGLLYAWFPLMQYLRVAARFGMFTYLFIGLIAAFVLAELSALIPRKAGRILAVALIACVFLEYWNKPFDFVLIPDSIRAFYTVVGKQQGMRVLLELPMGNLSDGYSSARYQYVDAQYLFRATNLHDKILFNGYSGVIPRTYQMHQKYLSANFPTPEKLIQLTLWGVDGIALHKDQFIYPDDFDALRSKLKGLGLREVIFNGNDDLFDLHVSR